MEKDFYLDERWLAAYFEKDWSDHVLLDDGSGSIQFDYPKFARDQLYSKYHEEFVDFLVTEAKRLSLHPRSMLEIGSSLGRTFYEICKKQPSLRVATLVEPSRLLADNFTNIFKGSGVSKFPMLQGNRELQEVVFDSRHIQKVCEVVDCILLNSEFKNLEAHKTYDLVVCSNVIDQCQDPKALVQLLKESTNSGGLLALTCSYQWNDKHIEPSQQDIANVATLFSSEWELLSEKNIEFKCRRSERHWLTFLSHALVFTRR